MRIPVKNRKKDVPKFSAEVIEVLKRKVAAALNISATSEEPTNVGS